MRVLQGFNEIVSLFLQIVVEGEAAEVPLCITDHPGFLAVYTNEYVLCTAWFQYKQQYKDSCEGPEHNQLRHFAYRQLARWGWGCSWQGSKSCTSIVCSDVHKAAFPSSWLEENFTFEGFHHADE